MNLDLKTKEDLAAAIRELTQDRGAGKSICPSEAARKVANDCGTPDNWRWMMKPLRGIAQDMARRGEIVILRKGRPIPPEELRGVVRLALTPKPGMERRERPAVQEGIEGPVAGEITEEGPPPWRGMINNGPARKQGQKP